MKAFIANQPTSPEAHMKKGETTNQENHGRRGPEAAANTSHTALQYIRKNMDFYLFFWVLRRKRRGFSLTRAHYQCWNVYDLKNLRKQHNITSQLTRQERNQRIETSQPLKNCLGTSTGNGHHSHAQQHAVETKSFRDCWDDDRNGCRGTFTSQPLKAELHPQTSRLLGRQLAPLSWHELWRLRFSNRLRNCCVDSCGGCRGTVFHKLWRPSSMSSLPTVRVTALALYFANSGSRASSTDSAIAAVPAVLVVPLALDQEDPASLGINNRTRKKQQLTTRTRPRRWHPRWSQGCQPPDDS